jgi:hypothetical protein
MQRIESCIETAWEEWGMRWGYSKAEFDRAHVELAALRALAEVVRAGLPNIDAVAGDEHLIDMRDALAAYDAAKEV